MSPCERFTGNKRRICEGDTPNLPHAKRLAYLSRWLTPEEFAAMGLPSRGLGDTVTKITRATGLSKLAKAVERVTGKPCGCGKRAEALNALVPFRTAEAAAPESPADGQK